MQSRLAKSIFRGVPRRCFASEAASKSKTSESAANQAKEGEKAKQVSQPQRNQEKQM